MIQSWSLRTTF